MKKNIFCIIVCLSLLLPAWASAKKTNPSNGKVTSTAVVVGAGEKEKIYKVGVIHSVTVSSGVDVVYTVTSGDKNNKVKVVTSSSDLLDRVEVRSANGKLSIGMRQKNGRNNNTSKIKGKITAYVNGPAPSTVSVSSGASFTNKSRFDISGGSFTATASSGGDIEISGLKAVGVTVKVSSGADVDLDNCTTGTISLSASSGSDIDIKGLNCSDLRANASSGADIEVEKASVSGTTAFSGSSGSAFKISGNGKHVDFTVSSGADVNAENFVAKTGVASTSASGGNIKCNVEELEVSKGKIRNKKR